MRKALEAWKWSLATLVRSWGLRAALTVLLALWGLAAYEWLWIPESSALLLLASSLYAVVQMLVSVAIIAASAASAGQAASAGAERLLLRSFFGFTRKQFLQSFVVILVGILLALGFFVVFGWVNRHSVEVASFLTFRSEKPVSHVAVENVYGAIEGLLWIVLAGFVLSFLVNLLHAGWSEAGKKCASTLAGCCFKAPFLTGLLSVAVFGGLPLLLANWHPRVSPGFWDYTQMIARLGVALGLLVTGWLFWLLSLARLHLPRNGNVPS